jgi:hypothetical protein
MQIILESFRLESFRSEALANHDPKNALTLPPLTLFGLAQLIKGFDTEEMGRKNNDAVDGIPRDCINAEEAFCGHQMDMDCLDRELKTKSMCFEVTYREERPQVGVDEFGRPIYDSSKPRTMCTLNGWETSLKERHSYSVARQRILQPRL